MNAASRRVCASATSLWGRRLCTRSPVGAAGGAAPDAYTPSLTSSQDIEQFTVQFLPNDLHALDFGHADIFTANEAEGLAWQPILAWIKAHQEERTYP